MSHHEPTYNTHHQEPTYNTGQHGQPVEPVHDTYNTNVVQHMQQQVQHTDQMGGEANFVLQKLEGRRCCLKCILSVVQCCQILIIIIYVMAYSILNGAKEVEDPLQCPPGYTYQFDNDKTRCYNKDDIDKAKLWYMVSIIATVLMFIIVGGLYHAISKFEPRRIDIFLIILTVIWFINAIFSIIANSDNDNDKSDSKNYLYGGIGFWGLIYIGFVFYTHTYANLIRELLSHGYPVDQCKF